ncbi:MAG: tRNA pseudouridine(55) synthase TruB [Desulfobaccales bacterium]
MISGLLLMDKPAGLTSFEVVRRVRRVLRVKKAGHLGTLDPFATGLLPLALGEATKLVQFLLEESKVYLAALKLGVETDTHDLTGRVTKTWAYLPSAAEIRRAAARFEGEIEQVPPLYSAVHHQGERLYKLARRGEQVEAAPRNVTIQSLEIQEIALPLVTLRLECSKGTYVRALARDLGRALGCGAHLTALRRLAVGPFRLEEALSLEEIEQLKEPEAVWPRLIPLADCLPGFRAVRVNPGEARRLAQGQALPWPGNSLAEGENVRVLTDGVLLAVAAVRPGKTGRVLAPLRVFGGAPRE